MDSILVPLGVCGVIALGGYLQTRAALHGMDLASKERLAALEKGVSLPPAAPPPPVAPTSRRHPLGAALAALAVGLALLAVLEPGNLAWGAVPAAFGAAGLVHWMVAGKAEWERQLRLDEELHRAYLRYLESAGAAAPPRERTE